MAGLSDCMGGHGRIGPLGSATEWRHSVDMVIPFEFVNDVWSLTRVHVYKYDSDSFSGYFQF